MIFLRLTYQSLNKFYILHYVENCGNMDITKDSGKNGLLYGKY